MESAVNVDVRCTHCEGIIGLDFLKQYQALVNVAKQRLQLENKLYSLALMGWDHGTQPLQSVTQVMPHEGKVEVPVNIVNMSQAEVEIPQGTQRAVLELRDVLVM
ncbi:hypothetical protein PR048_031857 [Dryococelus australis]|uniref:Uncharacterized protein n=1 Tax=Dryococelus australis TaxID=614101 RepID=A0ABQ9G9D5_9NEOP|nr:hypothetical protein PR048_031857 [Dryococelus australis]